MSQQEQIISGGVPSQSALNAKYPPFFLVSHMKSIKSNFPYNKLCDNRKLSLNIVVHVIVDKDIKGKSLRHVSSYSIQKKVKYISLSTILTQAYQLLK